MNIAVFGLGKLGAPLLAVLAKAGHYVTGVDINKHIVNLINDGKAPSKEPHLQHYLDTAIGHYKATTNAHVAVQQTDVAFVIVPTPTDESGGFSLEYCRPVFEAIGSALRDKTSQYLIVLVSTVMPGQTAELCRIVERVSGLQHGKGFGLVYNPEFIALGSVIRGIEAPDYVLIGADQIAYAEQLSSLYDTFLARADDVPRAIMSWRSAEITKIAQNAYITMKITFANELGRLCAQIDDADVDSITRALGFDRRIGPHYLKAGTAYGGPCFPRDNRAFRAAAQIAGVTLKLPEVVDVLNRLHQATLALQVRLASKPGDVIAIMGASYKPNTHVCEESASIDLARQLAGDFHVALFDERETLQDAMQYLPKTVSYHAMHNGAFLFLPAWERITVVWMHPTLPRNNVGLMTPQITAIIDPWRVLKQFSNTPIYMPFSHGHKQFNDPKEG